MRSFLQNYIYLNLIAIFVVLLSISCSDSVTDPGKPVFTGITETNEIGEIMSIDPGDWACADSSYAPNDTDSSNTHILPSKFCFGPAYPNPTNDRTSIEMTFPVSTHATIIVSDGGSYTDTLFSEAFDAGAHVFEWNGESLPKKIYRFTISAGDWKSYGDVDLR